MGQLLQNSHSDLNSQAILAVRENSGNISLLVKQGGMGGGVREFC